MCVSLLLPVQLQLSILMICFIVHVSGELSLTSSRPSLTNSFTSYCTSHSSRLREDIHDLCIARSLKPIRQQSGSTYQIRWVAILPACAVAQARCTSKVFHHSYMLQQTMHSCPLSYWCRGATFSHNSPLSYISCPSQEELKVDGQTSLQHGRDEVPKNTSCPTTSIISQGWSKFQL